MATIRELISRRTDLSTFVVHLTRRSPARTAAQNLEGILTTDCLEARTCFGAAVSTLKQMGAEPRDLDSQKCVCFTETPLEHLHLLLEEITDLPRQCVYEPYGIAMTKRMARRAGINPVWYTDITPTGHVWLMNDVNELVERAFQRTLNLRAMGDSGATFGDHPIARLAPFIEQMGSGVRADGVPYRKEFWWEREWRRRGNLSLPWQIIVIAPREEHERFHGLANDPPFRTATLIDARWGLEEIIGHLAGFSDDQVGPPV